jgi:hypothetical protein
MRKDPEVCVPQEVGASLAPLDLVCCGFPTWRVLSFKASASFLTETSLFSEPILSFPKAAELRDQKA